MTISSSIQEWMKSSSWIRKMFETGLELKQKFGAQNVFDFSLGSPMLEPPAEFATALRELANNPPLGMHRYMLNAGHPSTRQKVAEYLTIQEGVKLTAHDIIMTVGAAGAMNVAMASICDPGDETIILAPYFAEYLFYIRHHAGVERIVETTEDFDLDLAAIEAAINPRTKAMIINTPNNPTGRIYSEEKIAALGQLLQRKQKELDRSIYLLVDTPYAKIVYDGQHNPRFFRHYENMLIAHSFSKDLGLAGERIGYLALNPAAPYHKDLIDAFTFTIRTLGFVNAPSILQLAIEKCLHANVEIDQYRKLRDLLCNGLSEAGYEIVKPHGGFYLYMKSPLADDLAFTQELLKENVLVVPGRGFGRTGYVRIAYCVEAQVIEKALPHFKKVLDRVR